LNYNLNGKEDSARSRADTFFLTNCWWISWN